MAKEGLSGFFSKLLATKPDLGKQITAGDWVPNENTTDSVDIHILTPEEEEVRRIELAMQIFEEEIELTLADNVYDLTDMVRIIDNYPPDVAPMVLFKAATNVMTSQGFCERLRTNFSEIIPNSEEIPGVTGEFNAADLYLLAHRWGLPLCLVRLGNNRDFGHFCLGIRDSEKYGDGERMLIYDPMRQGERWLQLPNNWQNMGAEQSGVLIGFSTFWDDSNGNLGLSGENDLADSSNLIESKRQRLQFDAVNCGPLTMYAAMLRTAFQEGDNSFKRWGRFKLEEDTQLIDEDGNKIPGSGIKIYTIEEIRDKKTWGQDRAEMDAKIEVF